MGYYTRFELEIDRDGDAVIEDLKETSDYGAFYKEGATTWRSEDSWKWYDHEDELKAVSLRHPLSRISVTGYGEEQGDIWRKYFVAGQMQKHKLEITFPPCTLTPPKTNYATISVTVMGVDIPVEVEYVGEKNEDELYELAREQVRRIL